MLVHLYADPSCPFSWLVRRWLVAAVGPDDELVVRPLSLGLLNEGEEVPEPYAGHQAAAIEVLRVLEAVREADGDVAVAAAYDAVGARFHVAGTASFDDLPEALEEAGSDAALLGAAGDEAWDEVLREAMAEAHGLVGESVGSPVVALPDLGVAFWGPVLQAAPTGDDARRLLDALVVLTGTDGFVQVKRALAGELDLR